MEPIKTKAIEMDVRTLANLGCKFKVISPDGDEYGELVAAPAKSQRTKINNFAECGYAGKVRAMAVGASLTLPCQNAEAIDSFRSAMVGCGIRSFGKGSMISDIDRSKGEVTVLRQW